MKRLRRLKMPITSVPNGCVMSKLTQDSIQCAAIHNSNSSLTESCRSPLNNFAPPRTSDTPGNVRRCKLWLSHVVDASLFPVYSPTTGGDLNVERPELNVKLASV